jgi:hypothetical protein
MMYSSKYPISLSIGKILLEFAHLPTSAHMTESGQTQLYRLYNGAVLDRYNIIHPKGNALQLECNTLDNTLVNERADVIKMDLEGAEVLALKGTANVLSTQNYCGSAWRHPSICRSNSAGT